MTSEGGAPAFGGAYAGRRVLVTGHTGFKGAWLTAWLLSLGAEVCGFADGVPTQPSLFELAGSRTAFATRPATSGWRAPVGR